MRYDPEAIDRRAINAALKAKFAGDKDARPSMSVEEVQASAD